MINKREFRHHTENNNAQRQEIEISKDFNANRMKNKLKIKARRESGNRPEGNNEYEQMIAEDVSFNVQKMIEEAAYFIAMRRCFVPGNDIGDWLQAEKDIDDLLHGTIIDHVIKPLRAGIHA